MSTKTADPTSPQWKKNFENPMESAQELSGRKRPASTGFADDGRGNGDVGKKAREDSQSLFARTLIEVGELLTCPVCRSFYKNPVVPPCFHPVCKQCLEAQQKDFLSNFTCATCRCSFPDFKLRPEHRLRKVVEVFQRIHPFKQVESQDVESKGMLLPATQVGTFSQVLTGFKETSSTYQPIPPTALLDEEEEQEQEPEDDKSTGQIAVSEETPLRVPEQRKSTPPTVKVGDASTMGTSQKGAPQSDTSSRGGIPAFTPPGTGADQKTPPTVQLETQLGDGSSTHDERVDSRSSTTKPPQFKILIADQEPGFQPDITPEATALNANHPPSLVDVTFATTTTTTTSSGPNRKVVYDRKKNVKMVDTANVKSEGRTQMENEAKVSKTSLKKDPFRIGAIVTVQRRMGPGENKPGGVAKILSRNEDGTINVKYTVEGRREKNVSMDDVLPGIDQESTSMFGTNATKAGAKDTAATRNNKVKTTADTRNDIKEVSTSTPAPAADASSRKKRLNFSSKSIADSHSDASNNYVIVLSGEYSEAQKRAYKDAMKILKNGRIMEGHHGDSKGALETRNYQEDDSESWSLATHIVIPSEDLLAIKRTPKYFQGISLGRWIVDIEWLSQSSAQGVWLNEAPFEIKGDVVSKKCKLPMQGPKRSRLASLVERKSLLSQVFMACIGQDQAGNPDYVKLAENLGAHVFANRIIQPSKFNLQTFLDHSKTILATPTCVLVVLDNQVSADVVTDQVTVVKGRWLLDCVSSFKRLPFSSRTSSYLLNPVTSADSQEEE